MCRVLRYRYRLGKEVSLRKKRVRRLGVPERLCKRRWGRGPRRPVSDCVDARLLQRALFPRNPQSASARPGLPLRPGGSGPLLGPRAGTWPEELHRFFLCFGIGKAKCARAIRGPNSDSSIPSSLLPCPNSGLRRGVGFPRFAAPAGST